MSFRLLLALALSLAMHGVLLLPDMLKRFSVAPPRPVLQASLRLPPRPDPAPAPLLKNTLEDDAPRKEAASVKTPPPAAPPKPSPKPGPVKKVTQREMQAVQRKLSQYIYYPEAARQRGLEGTVEVFVELAADGSVDDVRLIRGTGHAILDNAAIKGFYAVGRLPGTSARWSYSFRLVP